MSTSSTVKVSVPVFGIVGLCLVIAKLGGIDPVASWSWWLVTLPFWFGIVVAIAFLAIFSASCCYRLYPVDAFCISYGIVR